MRLRGQARRSSWPKVSHPRLRCVGTSVHRRPCKASWSSFSAVMSGSVKASSLTVNFPVYGSDENALRMESLSTANRTSSFEDMDGENEVRESLVYSFQTMRQFRTLDTDQRRVVRSLLSEVEERDPSKFVRDHAAEAIALIDRGRY